MAATPRGPLLGIPFLPLMDIVAEQARVGLDI